MSNDKNAEPVDLTDGEDVEFRFERDQYYAMGTGQMEVHKGKERERMVFLSKEFTTVDFNGKGKRVFTCPEWYANGKGLL